MNMKGNIGFDFLGFTIRQFPLGKNQSGKKTNGKTLGFKTLIIPSKEKVKTHNLKIGQTIHKHKSSPQATLIKELNPIIRGWTNYYATVVSKEIFSICDNIVYQQLRRWAYRRHPKQKQPLDCR
jgi:RNA-directed DNA polymerase